MNKLMAWFRAQPRATQLLIALGVPAVAVAAVYGSRKAPVEPGTAVDAAGKPVTTPTTFLLGNSGGDGEFDGLNEITAALDAQTNALTGLIEDQALSFDDQLTELEQDVNSTKPDWWWKTQSKGTLWQYCYKNFENGHGPHPKAIQALREKGIRSSDSSGTGPGAQPCRAALDAAWGMG